MKRLLLMLSVYYGITSYAQFNFPKEVMINPTDIRFVHLGITKITQYHLLVVAKDSIHYQTDSSAYSQPDFVFNYDTIGRLISYSFNYTLLPPLIENVMDNDSINIRLYDGNQNIQNYDLIKYNYNESVIQSEYKKGIVFNQTNDIPGSIDYVKYFSKDSIQVIKHYNQNKQLELIEYFDLSRNLLYSKSFFYNTYSKNDIRYNLLVRVIGSVRNVEIKHTILQYSN